MMKRLISLLLTLSMLASLCVISTAEGENKKESDFPFKDVLSNKWYYSEILMAWQSHIVEGISETSFAPDLPVTRAMAATMLWRMAGAQKPNDTYVCPFDDVLESSWYYDAINWCAENKIMLGISDTAAAPTKMITRQDFITLMYRYAGSQWGEAFLCENPGIFAVDEDQISGYALSPIRWAIRTKTLFGADHKLNPLGTASRAEATCFIVRLSHRISQSANAASDTTNAFACKLMEELNKEKQDNPLISAPSVIYALLMAANGAKGETLAQFEQLFGVNAEDLNELAEWLYYFMEQNGHGIQVETANSVWIDDCFSLDESYRERLADMSADDTSIFERNLTEATDEINKWVCDQTHGMIPQFLREPLSEDAMMALINTLYLYAGWETRFDRADNRLLDFTCEDGKTVPVVYLTSDNKNTLYFNEGGVEGVILPYTDGRTAYIAMRPVEGSKQLPRQLAKTLDGETLRSYIKAAKKTWVDLSLPKYETSYRTDMTKALQSMGLTLAFDAENADFSGMGTVKDDPNANLFISTVQQETRLRVNELGTEAAAVTAVVMECTSALDEGKPVTLAFDSSFVYAVVDIGTGMPLFEGVLTKPAAAETEEQTVSITVSKVESSAYDGMRTFYGKDADGNTYCFYENNISAYKSIKMGASITFSYLPYQSMTQSGVTTVTPTVLTIN